MVTSSPTTGRATLTDTAGVALYLLAPTLDGGVIARRPALFGLADRLEADRRAVRRMRELASRWRVIRRVVLGDGARNDHEISDLLARLRREANWGYLAPRREKVYRRFKARLGGYLDRAEPNSLASVIADTPAGPGLAPEDQVPQWLFAYDPAGLATLRALALLATHDDSVRRAREQLHREEGASPALTEELRASVLESVRLWPTTLPQAHRYAPETWYERRGPDDWPLVPFSEGPGVCPGQNLVLLTATTFLATLLRRHDYRLVGGPLDPHRPLPMTFSPYRLRLRVTPVAGRG